MVKWWRYVPSRLAHALAGSWARWLSQRIEYFDASWQPRELYGLTFRNPLGLAAGLDKNAAFFEVFEPLGFGFVEIGTVTLKPQKMISGGGLKRYWKHQVIWNYMGFPNDGIKKVCQRIKQSRWFDLPIFLSIGKSRHCRFEEFIHEELPTMLSVVPDRVNVVVLNLSSPNTVGLTGWQTQLDRLRSILRSFQDHYDGIKAIKLGPDWESQLSFFRTLEAISEFSIQFLILTNSTTQRVGLPKSIPSLGGVSGSYLTHLSRWWLQQAVQFSQQHLAPWKIISVGGILSPQEVWYRLELGADLVQVYSALVFEGFLFARNVAQWVREKKQESIQ